MVSITDPFKAIAGWFTPDSRGKEIIKILQQIAKGNFKYEVKVPRGKKKDEHRQILKGLKLTLKELKKMKDREKRRRRQIINANKQLRVLDKNKREFMELASHQLKTPLASMQLGLDLLDKKALIWGNEDRMILAQITDSYQHLLKLVKSLLAAVKVDEKIAMKPKLQSTSVSQVVNTLSKQYSNRFRAKGIEFNIKRPISAPKIKTDPEFIIEILHNLLENALRYTHQGKVNFSVIYKDGKVEFQITDTGVGLPLAEQKQAFDKLFRASNVKNLSDPGTGLGLYYTKQLVKKLKGRIWFESEEGKGSTFYVSLPR